MDGFNGFDGLLPLLLGGGGGGGEGFGGGLGGSGGGGFGGLSPLLLLLLLGGRGRGFGFGQQSGSGCSCSSSGSGSGSGSGELPASFNDFLTANVGRRVKLVLGTQTFVLAGQEITCRLVAVGSDYVIIDRICINGVPVLDPRRLTLKIATIDGIERLTYRDRIVELVCALD